MFGLSLEGDAALHQVLAELGPEIEEKVTVDAMRKAAGRIVAAAKQNAMKLGTRSVRRAAQQMVGSLQRKVARLARRGKTEKARAAIQRTIRRAQRMKGTPHQLANSIGYRLKRYTAQGVVFVAVGPKWPEGAHGHLVEYGHRTATHRSGTLARRAVKSRLIGNKFRYAAISKVTGQAGGGTVRNKVPAHPFMRPAWDANRQEALNLVTALHRANVERIGQRKSYTVRSQRANPASPVGVTWTQIHAFEAG